MLMIILAVTVLVALATALADRVLSGWEAFEKQHIFCYCYRNWIRRWQQSYACFCR